MDVLLHDTGPQRILAGIVLNELSDFRVLLGNCYTKSLVGIFTWFQDPNVPLCLALVLLIVIGSKIIELWISQAFDMKCVRQTVERVFA
jgi:hypothetical protein